MQYDDAFESWHTANAAKFPAWSKHGLFLSWLNGATRVEFVDDDRSTRAAEEVKDDKQEPIGWLMATGVWDD